MRSAVEHAEAVERLRASYAAAPAGQPVRLAKRTSNLFRPRVVNEAPGLDVSGLDGVLEVDAEARTATVQGMCTYEHLVAATLPHGLIPYVVPQLKTITVGGAVSGLGIESTSFRRGLPHESVREIDIFTGAGEVLTAGPDIVPNVSRIRETLGTTPTGNFSDLFEAFPNSYGCLGYATRIRIDLERVPAYVALRHVRFGDADALAAAVAAIAETHEYDGVRVDGLDGVGFAPGELYLTLATWTDERGPTSDYTGHRIYYRSIREHQVDRLTMHDYLWRWDTDWFWCSGAFGAQHPIVRRLWPRRYRRSDVFHRLVGLDRRFDIADRLDRRAGRPLRERVIQDVEVPVKRLAEFLDWFDREIGMRPVWLCPLVSTGLPAGGAGWPGYPLEPGATYVNVGFWGTVHVGPDAVNAPHNRAIEAKVHELGGHKSLYSEAFYDRATFDQLYNGARIAEVKRRYDPEHRLIDLYDKVVKRR